MNYLLQPKKYKSLMSDEGSRAIMDKTINFFETMGKTRITEDFNKKVCPPPPNSCASSI